MTTDDTWDAIRRVAQRLGVIEDELLDRAIPRDDLAAQVGDLAQTLEALMERVAE
jgi:hypothetical protein